MKPSIAHFLIDTFVPKGGKVLDPFAGAGTIPFEACLQGREAYGFEISPVALAVSIGKVVRSNRVEVDGIMKNLRDYITTETLTEAEIAAADEINFNGRVAEFYHENTFREILLARRFFSSNTMQTAEGNFVLACLLHILHGNRPYALSRRSHPVTPFLPTGPYEYRPLIERLRAKIERSLNVEYPEEFRDGHVFKQDATLWWPEAVEDIDCIITSPPFFDSTRFYLANWIRLWFCGWERRDFDIQPLHFLETRQKQSMAVYESIFRQARERLKSDGILILHLGKSTKCNMATEIIRVARPWFKVLDLFEESVSHCESHGITDKGEVATHQYLVLG